MKRAAILACAIGIGCDGPTAPVRPADAVDVTLEFCPSSAPVWMAYRNDGHDWIRVPQTAFQSVFTFPATPRVSVAYASVSSSGFRLRRSRAGAGG